jgi:hypothetical protein
MKIHKSLFPVALLVVLALLAVGFYCVRQYRQDVRALADFSAAYQRLDKAIADYSAPVLDPDFQETPASAVLAGNAADALDELDRKASIRLSSLIKHDGELMRTTFQIANLSTRELNAVAAFRKAIAEKSPDLDRPAFLKQLDDLTRRRQAAYAHFRELARM